jgi:hypothetical protein
MAWKVPIRAAAIAAGLALALVACGGGGSLDGSGDGDDGSDNSDGGDGNNGDLQDLLGELGIDSDDFEGLDLEDLENLDLGALEDVDGGDLDNIGDLGSLSEIFGALGLEELIEQNADGDVDLEFGDDGFSVESDDGSFSIDKDGSFTVTDEDGEETTGDFDLDAEGGDLSIESDDGSVEFNSGSELPEDWPTEVPEPDGVTIQSAMTVAEDDGSSIIVTGTIQDDPDEWAGGYGSQLESAGFNEDSNFTNGGNVTAFYTNDTLGVTVIAASVGDDTTVSISITQMP